MTEPVIRIYSDISELNTAAAELFVELSNEAVEDRGFFSVALAGGSTPKALYRLLASEDYRKQIVWDKVRFFWGDERFVPRDHHDSNYKMAVENLLSMVPVPDGNIFPVPTENNTPEEAAQLYEQILRKNVQRFDLILLGLGEDGHTASLFPHTAALKETERWVAHNYVDKLRSYRITMTFPAIRNSATILFVVAGESKASILKEILEAPLDPERLPAQTIRTSRIPVFFLIDRDAGSLLEDQ